MCQGCDPTEAQVFGGFERQFPHFGRKFSYAPSCPAAEFGARRPESRVIRRCIRPNAIRSAGFRSVASEMQASVMLRQLPSQFPPNLPKISASARLHPVPMTYLLQTYGVIPGYFNWFFMFFILTFFAKDRPNEFSSVYPKNSSKIEDDLFVFFCLLLDR